MSRRFARALDYLAAAVVAVALVALPFSTLLIATGHYDSEGLIAFVPACLVAGVAVARLVHGPGWSSMLAAIIGSGAVTWLCGFIFFVLGLQVLYGHSLCGHAPATAIAYIGAVAVYAVVGGWALTGTGGPRFFLGPSAGAALGIAWALVALALFPGGHGYCET
jgi:branched-subunit amino acid transport protein